MGISRESIATSPGFLRANAQIFGAGARQLPHFLGDEPASLEFSVQKHLFFLGLKYYKSLFLFIFIFLASHQAFF